MSNSITLGKEECQLAESRQEDDKAGVFVGDLPNQEKLITRIAKAFLCHFEFAHSQIVDKFTRRNSDRSGQSMDRQKCGITFSIFVLGYYWLGNFARSRPYVTLAEACVLTRLSKPGSEFGEDGVF